MTSSCESKTLGCVTLCVLQASKETMSELESSMASIIRVFHKYSGHKCNLRKAELKALINNEMSHFIMVRYLFITGLFLTALYNIKIDITHNNLNTQASYG